MKLSLDGREMEARLTTDHSKATDNQAVIVLPGGEALGPLAAGLADYRIVEATASERMDLEASGFHLLDKREKTSGLLVRRSQWCPKCANLVFTTAAACPRCGTHIDSTEIETPLAATQRTRTGLKAQGILTGILFVTALAGFSWFFGTLLLGWPMGAAIPGLIAAVICLIAVLIVGT